MLIKPFFIFAAVIIVCSTAFSQVTVRLKPSEGLKSAAILPESVKGKLQNYKLIEVSNITQIIEESPQNIRLELGDILPYPIQGLPEYVMLQPVNILARDAKVVAATLNGEVPIEMNMGFYCASLSHNSWINICFSKFGLRGLIKLTNQTFIIEPQIQNEKSFDNVSFVYELNDLHSEQQANLAKSELALNDSLHSILGNFGNLKSSIINERGMDTDSVITYKIAIDLSYGVFSNIYGFYKNENAASYIVLERLTEISEMFRHELRIKFEVVHFRIFTDPAIDYGYGISGCGGSQDQYVYCILNKWKEKMSHIDTDFMLYLVFEDTGGAVASFGGYAGCDILTMGHELGHLCGAPHTFDCAWPAGIDNTIAPIDSCSNFKAFCGCLNNNDIHGGFGSIMSYCTQKFEFEPFTRKIVKDQRSGVNRITPLKNTIKGRVTFNDIGLGKVVVRTSNMSNPVSVLTNDDGYYSFEIEANGGSPEISAALEGYKIQTNTPAFYNVSTTTINFKAYKENEIDIYEPDNSMASSKEIKTDGSPQQRFSNDEDFIKFKTEKGLIYFVEVINQLDKPINNYNNGKIDFDIISESGEIISSNSFYLFGEQDPINIVAGYNGYYFVKVKSSDKFYRVIVRQGNFREISKINLNSSYTSISWCDFDIDGDQDLFVYGPDIKVFKNENSVLTQTPTFLDNLTNIMKIDWRDINRDGFPDLLVLTSDNENSLFKIINKNGILTNDTSQNAFLAKNVRSFSISDLNSDGDLEIIYCKNGNYPNNEIRTLKLINKEYRDSLLIEDKYIDVDNIIISDMNNDTFPDIVNRMVYYNDGTGGFFSKDKLYYLNYWASVVKDLNNDGRNDVIYKHIEDNFVGDVFIGQSDHYSIYLNSGDKFTNFYSDKIADNITVIDFDGNGINEVFVLGKSFSVNDDKIENVSQQSVYLNGPTEWADFNGDKKPDYAIINGDYLQLFGNISQNRNESPGCPASMFTEVFNGKIKLKWGTGSDDNTPVNALNYNIRIGTSPTNCNIVSPLSVLQSGKLIKINENNCGSNLNFNLGKLITGKYYWTVQSIDNSGNSSSWAPVQTFDISKSNTSPIVSKVIPDVTLSKGEEVGIDLNSYFKDADNEQLEYKVFCNDIKIVNCSLSDMKLMLKGLKDGIVEIRILVTDSNTESVSAKFKATVKTNKFFCYSIPDLGAIMKINDKSSRNCSVLFYNNDSVKIEIQNNEKYAVVLTYRGEPSIGYSYNMNFLDSIGPVYETSSCGILFQGYCGDIITMVEKGIYLEEIDWLVKKSIPSNIDYYYNKDIIKPVIVKGQNGKVFLKIYAIKKGETSLVISGLLSDGSQMAPIELKLKIVTIPKVAKINPIVSKEKILTKTDLSEYFRDINPLNLTYYRFLPARFIPGKTPWWITENLYMYISDNKLISMYNKPGITDTLRIRAANSEGSSHAFETLISSGDPVGVREMSKSEISVFPNPFYEEFQISGSEELSKIIFSNSLGQQVKIIENPERTVKVSDLVPGIYFMTVYDKSENVVKTEKIVKM